MSKGKRIIPQETRDKVLAFLEEGYSYAATGRMTSVHPDTAKSIWYETHTAAPPCIRSQPVPLRVVRSYIRRCRVIDYECPHCGALIHHAVIDFQEKPWRCSYCGREVE